MSAFALYVGIDYSGAQTPTARLKSLQVFAAQPGARPQSIATPAIAAARAAGVSGPSLPRYWTRSEVACWLIGLAQADQRFIAGIDHGFSFPASYFERYGLTFWPFDGWQPPAGKSVIAEVYPSIFRNRYDREGRTPDAQDAYAVARWLAESAARSSMERYFNPPLTLEERLIAKREGWILGIS